MSIKPDILLKSLSEIRDPVGNAVLIVLLIHTAGYATSGAGFPIGYDPNCPELRAMRYLLVNAPLSSRAIMQ